MSEMMRRSKRVLLRAAKLVAAVTLLHVATGCGSDAAAGDDEPWMPTSGAIGFNVSVAEGADATRGAMVTDATLSEFYVTAISYRRWNAANIPTPNLMYDVRVSRNGDIWSTADTYFWPSANKVRFFAYSPQSPSVTLSPADHQGVPALSYTIPDDVTQQPDIVVAATEELNADDYNGHNGQPETGVNLTFHHVLTAVSIRLADTWSATDVTIETITFNNVYGAGEFVMDNYWLDGSTGVVDGAAEGWTLSDKRSFTVNVNKQAVPGMGLNDGEATLMMLPQTLGDDAVMEVVLGHADGTSEVAHVALGATTWGIGRRVTYTLTR